MFYLSMLSIIIGRIIGTSRFKSFTIPIGYVRYMAIAILACLDSVFGGLRANMENKFDNIIFVTGFFINSLLAALLVYLGDKLGFDLALAAIVVFGVRIFQNLAIIRRILLDKIILKGKEDRFA